MRQHAVRNDDVASGPRVRRRFRHAMARVTKEVHADDSAELEAAIHLADLELESIEAMTTDCEPIDLPHKDVLVASDTT